MKREWRKFLTVALGTQLAVTGCATPHRLPAVPIAQMSQTSQALGPIRFLVSRETQSSFAEAASLLVKEQQWRASQGQSPELPTAYFLAVSGGGDNGAYGAGFLKGWTATGSRPEFKVVTGVSTGALIAPFAFLGPRYDYVLERVYTTSAQKDIFKKRGILKGLFGDGMADTRPLAQTIQTYVNRQLLDAIAARKDPDAIALFSKIPLASASIPGAFPPVMIDVTLDGHHYQEMHVDGGTTTQLFLYPPTLSLATGQQRKRVAY